MNKYEFTGNSKVVEDGTVAGATVYQIKHLGTGNLGGWIAGERNLSQEGDCWVDDNACVFNYAVVSEGAYVGGNCLIGNSATIKGNARVLGQVIVSDNGCIKGNAVVIDNVHISTDGVVEGNVLVVGHVDIIDQTVSGEGVFNKHLRLQ